jgi:hypothetical protein
MASTASELFDAALRQYAKHKGGQHLSTQYICVPHQLPPKLMDSYWSPPETDGEMVDQYVAGDHDCHAVMALVDGLTYHGHQALRVRRLAEKELSDLLPDSWRERVLCQLYSGHSITDPDYKRLADDLLWDCVWPEVDGDLLLTGNLVGDEDGYANVRDEAMMQEPVALAAGHTVDDGHVVLKGGQ